MRIVICLRGFVYLMLYLYMLENLINLRCKQNVKIIKGQKYNKTMIDDFILVFLPINLILCNQIN